MNTILINRQNVLVKQYKGQRVVTFKDIDAVHSRTDGTAGRNFRTNRSHFIEGEDFFKISPDEFRRTIAPMDKRQSNDVTVITESGYLMLVKSFTDDLSWEVQRQLVKSYFRGKEDNHTDKQLELYEYFDKTYNGEPVLSIADVSHMTGINRTTIGYFIRKRLTIGIDYYLLKKSELESFKAENPKVNKLASCMYVITKYGFDVICKAYGIKLETPKLFIEEKQEVPQDKIEPAKFVTPQLKEKMSVLRNNAERLIHLTYLLDNVSGTMMCGSTYVEFKKAIISQIKQLSYINL